MESFASAEEIQSLRKRMDELLNDFDYSTTASIFSTRNQVPLSFFFYFNKYYYGN